MLLKIYVGAIAAICGVGVVYLLRMMSCYREQRFNESPWKIFKRAILFTGMSGFLLSCVAVLSFVDSLSYQLGPTHLWLLPLYVIGILTITSLIGAPVAALFFIAGIGLFCGLFTEFALDPFWRAILPKRVLQICNATEAEY